VDFTRAEGQGIVRELARQADIVVENFKVGGLARYGLDYPNLAALNSRLVYCSITGFGQTGPYAERAGYDFIIQGMGGFMSVTGERDNAPGGGPQKAGIAISDLMTGMYAATAILAAVAHRERSGVGQYIDACLFDTQVAMMAVMNMNYLVSGTPPGRAGNAHQNIVPYQVFACGDGHLILAVGNDNQFARFCEVAGKPEWAVDPRFAANAARVQHRDTLVPMIAAVVRTRTQRDWLAALEAVGVPSGPINRLDQVFADPQVQARGMRFELAHPSAGAVPQVANPLHFSATPVAYTQAPPLLGEHTAGVLSERLRLSADALNDLAARGVVQLRP
jgi:crotonobetainyl-CoA:carnitine CoA-transferase CaiB-like acyl-CoA transferase